MPASGTARGRRDHYSTFQHLNSSTGSCFPLAGGVETAIEVLKGKKGGAVGDQYHVCEAIRGMCRLSRQPLETDYERGLSYCWQCEGLRATIDTPSVPVDPGPVCPRCGGPWSFRGKHAVRLCKRCDREESADVRRRLRRAG